jgi:hypothetical protein
VNEKDFKKDWIKDLYPGKPGSAQRLFYAAREAFASPTGRLDFVERFSRAFFKVDTDFFDRLAAGARAFARANKPQTSGEHLARALQMAHVFLSIQDKIPYTLKARRDLARDIYLCEQVLEELLTLPELPSLLDPTSWPFHGVPRKMLEREQRTFPNQKWTRMEARAGVPKVPPAPGGRPKGKTLDTKP